MCDEGDSEWVEWRGNECPVDLDDKVDYREKRCKWITFNGRRAGDLYWCINGWDSDITMYRLSRRGDFN